MDVRTLRLAGGLLVCLLGLTACNQKSVGSTFPESYDAAVACDGFKIKNKFLIIWEDGRVTSESAPNQYVFIERFLKPNLEQIRYVEFDRPVRSLPLTSGFDFQPHADDLAPNASATWGPTMIQATQVWSQGITGQGVSVGIVDSAVDYAHAQLQPRLDRNLAEINGLPGVDDDNNGVVDDFYGWDFARNQAQPELVSGDIHGSHVAGIVAADHHTGPIPGVAPDATIVPANFMVKSGTSMGGELSHAIAAMQYVAKRGVRVINGSWGGGDCSASLKAAIANLEQQNILFVAAAGNAYLDLDANPVEFPAAFELAPQITVAATRSNDNIAGFSNTGYRYVHLSAPGENIYSTVPGGYASLDGTSMAAPMVSGTAALLWSAKPNATVGQIKQALMTSVDTRNHRVMTRGRLNARKALEEIRRLVP